MAKNLAIETARPRESAAARLDAAGRGRLRPAGSVPGRAAGAPRIRLLSRRDLGEVIRIDAYHTGARKTDYWTRIFREFFGGRGRRGRVALAAEVDGTFAGYLLGEVRAFEFGSEPCGWVIAVAVAAPYLRRGVASRLLEAACRRFARAGVATVRTMVRRNDVPVLSFFRASGFAGGPYVQLERPARGEEPDESGRRA